MTPNTTKHSFGAALLKTNPKPGTPRTEEGGGRAGTADVRDAKTCDVYAEQPARGKHGELDPRVFLTPTNLTKRQQEQIPLQRKLPLRCLSSRRQTCGPSELFSLGDVSGCDAARLT